MAVRTAQTVVLRGMNVQLDGSRFETRSGNRAVIKPMPALVSVRHLMRGCKQQPYGHPGLGHLSLGEPRCAGVQCRIPARDAGAVVGSRRPTTATPWQRHAN